MKRVFKIGEVVWWEADHMSGWGTIVLINRDDTYPEYNCDDDDILTVKKKDGGEIEVWQENVYQISKYKFFGLPCVWDHLSEEYPLLCPDRQENLWMCETDDFLGPCFDKPKDVELYIKMGDSIKVCAYVWRQDDGRWALTEFNSLYIPVKELIYHDENLRTQFIVDEYEQDVQQYETRGMTDEEALDVCNNYFDRPLRELKYDDIAEDSPDGYYVNLL